MKRISKILALMLIVALSFNSIAIGASPNSDALTRGEFAILLWESTGSKNSNITSPFADLTQETVDAVNYLYERGTVLGVADNRFSPNDTITREMAYVMLSRYFNLLPHNDRAYVNFSDNLSISEWARSAASYIFESHNNVDGAIISAQNTLTREQAAALIAELGRLSQLDATIKEIMRSVDDATWSMEFAFAGSDEALYSVNRERRATPASAVKLFIAALAYEALGEDFTFHTPIYRTGPIVDGVLQGDLILRASGDLLFGGRVNPDGSLNLPQTDHGFGGFAADAVPVSDFPLDSLYDLAEQIVASGIREITGNIIVDTSLFLEERSTMGGSGGEDGYSFSPSMLNDNIVGIMVTPGENIGEPAILTISPETPYLTIINEITTTAPPENAAAGMMMGGFAQGPRFENDTLNPDGTRTITFAGEVAQGSLPRLHIYNVPEPAAFAASALHMILDTLGVSSNLDLLAVHDFDALSVHYTHENRIAEIISLPLRYQLMPMMKISSNVHPGVWASISSIHDGGDSQEPFTRWLEKITELFEYIGTESAVPFDEVQSVLEVVASLLYSPRYFSYFLNYVYSRPYFEDFLLTLPIMGVDGSLDDIDPNLPASGNVFAKSGTAMTRVMTEGGAQINVAYTLAGFIELPEGEMVTFSVFSEYSSAMPGHEHLRQAVAEIVNAVYEYLAAE
jgi:D-alanyl-D-alanine carboxypeptidase/D-alanyl-D-alanine-endopeptidase (penicillin-binding protein 4)